MKRDNELEQLLDDIAAATDESDRPMIGAVAAIDKPRPMEGITVQPVAEWYEARCLGTDGGICGWSSDGESRSRVIRASKVHVSATGHEVHVDTKNVECVLKRR